MAIPNLRSTFSYFRAKRQQRSTRVFISYTGRHPADEELAKKIHDLLRSHGVDVFIAPLAIDPGSDWRAVLNQRIVGCSHFVVIVSEASMRSEEVQSEIRLACARAIRSAQLRIVPILYGRAAINPFPAIQALSYRDHSAFSPIEISEHEELRYIRDRLVKMMGIVPHGSRGGPLPGRIVPLLCDRDEHEDAVEAVLAELSPGDGCAPAAFFIGGREDDNPESFVDRIVVTILSRHFRLDGSPVQIRVPWHGGWTRQSGPRALVTLVLEKLGLPVADGSPATFAGHLAMLSDPMIVLTHTMHADEWSLEETPAILRAYLKFWDGVCDAARKPFFVLFFQIVYAADGGTPAPSPRAIRASLGKAIKGRSRLRATLLRDLACVREKHVHRWFADYAGDVPESHRMEKIAALFATSTCQRMEIVESALRRIQAEFMENL